MSFDESVEEIITYAKSGDEIVYEKLTNDSKEELKNYSKTDILDSLCNYFHANSIMEIDNNSDDFRNTAEVILFNPNNRNYSKVMFLREDSEWKLRWNKRVHQKYI